MLTSAGRSDPSSHLPVLKESKFKPQVGPPRVGMKLGQNRMADGMGPCWFLPVPGQTRRPSLPIPTGTKLGLSAHMNLGAGLPSLARCCQAATQPYQANSALPSPQLGPTAGSPGEAEQRQRNGPQLLIHPVSMATVPPGFLPVGPQ